MTPANITLNFTRGEGVNHVFYLWQDVARTIPVDLTLYTGKSQIRPTQGDASALLGAFTVTTGGASINAITLVMTGTATALLAAGSAGADLFIGLSGQPPTCIAKISINILERYTVWP